MTDNDSKKQLGRISLEKQRMQRSVDVAVDTTEALAIQELKALSERFGVPALDLTQLCLRLSDLELIPREIAEQHAILPVLSRDDRLFVAMADPREKRIIDELEFVTGKRVFPYVAPREALLSAIERAYTHWVRGEAYYVAPGVPPEVLAKVGITRDGLPSNPAVAPQDAAVDQQPLSRAGLFVDDAIGRASRDNDQLDDNDFGDLSDEVSGITELPSSSDLHLKTILIVDDELEIRQMLKRLFGSKGYKVLEAATGGEALRRVKERTIDLMVLDAMLPEIHGFDIARRIKGTQRYKHIPIVMISAVYRGWRFAADLRESCGVEHYIEKPFRINEILQAVEDALTRRELRPEGDADQISEAAERELNLGVGAYKEGRTEDAILHLQRGLTLDPFAYRLHFHLGLLYGKQERIYEAIGELERAVEINSRHFSGVKNLAILYQKAGFRNKASEMWERALKAAPDQATRQSIKDHLITLF